MKNLWCCIAFLTVSNMSVCAWGGFVDSMNAATSCANVLSASSDDVVTETIKLPFSTESIGITFVAGWKGIGGAAMFDKNVYVIGIPMHTVVAVLLVSGGLYLVYKISSGKQEKSEKGQ